MISFRALPVYADFKCVVAHLAASGDNPDPALVAGAFDRFFEIAAEAKLLSPEGIARAANDPLDIPLDAIADAEARELYRGLVAYTRTLSNGEEVVARVRATLSGAGTAVAARDKAKEQGADIEMSFLPAKATYNRQFYTPDLLGDGSIDLDARRLYDSASGKPIELNWAGWEPHSAEMKWSPHTPLLLVRGGENRTHRLALVEPKEGARFTTLSGNPFPGTWWAERKQAWREPKKLDFSAQHKAHWRVTPDGKTALVLAQRPMRVEKGGPHEHYVLASLYDLPSGKQRLVIPAQEPLPWRASWAGEVRPFAIANDGSRAWFVRDHMVWYWKGGKSPIQSALAMNTGDEIRDLQLSPDGAVLHLLVRRPNKTFHLLTFDSGTNRFQKEIDLGDGWAELSRDGRWVAQSSKYDPGVSKHVTLHDLTTGKKSQPLVFPPGSQFNSFTQDGKSFAIFTEWWSHGEKRGRINLYSLEEAMKAEDGRTENRSPWP